ncbi:AraC family transcriptional regulator [Cohnella lupini]|uniref:AraC-like DNA-binding protein n=1 Tax=Cohnella lupini TaxID=1294267 RepID=A0A3D9HZS0_9BACL|nr:AraC family transcriptional regulator [Cohnella lupini]RED54406.1 AraC-like DNA-binding protein [Cohnella lupini]
MVKRTIEVSPAHIFFEEPLPYFVNRVEESYELHFHAHEFTEICYVGEGGGFHYIEDKTVPVSRGDLFILPLGTSHVFRPFSPNGRTPLVVYNFIFVAQRVAETLRHWPELTASLETRQLLNLEHGQSEWRHIRDTSGAFHTFFTDAYREFRLRQTGFVPRMHALFIVLLTEIERHLEAAGGNRAPGAAHRLIGNALALIHRTDASGITAARAAEASQMSERHFHRVFVKATGFTFNQYVQNARIERSCDLLRTTRMTVSEIVEAIGYQDKGYFLELFKRKTGQTPRAYRDGSNN